MRIQATLLGLNFDKNAFKDKTLQWLVVTLPTYQLLLLAYSCVAQAGLKEVQDELGDNKVMLKR